MENWHSGLASRDNEPELTSWVNDYLASWDPSEIAGLPEAFRPGRLRDAGDIEHWQRVLSDAYCAGAALDDNADRYAKMLSMFSAAVERARELGLIGYALPDAAA